MRTRPSAAVTAVFDTRLSGELTLTVATGIGWPSLPMMVMRRPPVSAAIAAPTKQLPNASVSAQRFRHLAKECMEIIQMYPTKETFHSKGYPTGRDTPHGTQLGRGRKR